MAKNDITGDEIATKAVNDLYRDGFDRIFGKPQDLLPPERECCGTFKGSPHRKTCEKWRGKKEPGNTGSSVLEEGKDDPEPV